MQNRIHEIKSRLNLGTKILVLASSNNGKSTLARELVNPYPRKIYIDIMREPEYQDMPSVDNINDFYRALKFYKSQKNFNLVYRMQSRDPKELKMDKMNDICKIVWAFKNVHLFVDECDLYTTPQMIPEWYEQLLRRGRHPLINVSMTNITQTPTSLNKMIVKQSDEKFYGFFSERNDLNYIHSLGTWSMDDLLAVKKYEFIHEYNRDWAKVKL